MRSVGLLLALCGCNQVLGIEPSILVDAQQFDSPLDAPYQCPPAGTAPQFSRLFHQVSTYYCNDYTFSTATNRAVAWCITDSYSAGEVWEGNLDTDDLHPTVGFETAAGHLVSQPRINPEGDEVYMRSYEGAGYQVSVYRRDTGGWIRQADLSLPVANYDSLLSVTRAPGRRLFLGLSGNTLGEYLSDDAGGWTEVGSYTAADFGLTGLFDPRVTADGLHVVFTGYVAGDTGNSVWYADRANLASRFSRGLKVMNVPVTFGAVLTEDCSRLYFSGLQSVFYVQQP